MEDVTALFALNIVGNVDFDSYRLSVEDQAIVTQLELGVEAC